ncbi:MAG: hypothetical protein ACK501_23180 [Planctomycetota bacterium]
MGNRLLPLLFAAATTFAPFATAQCFDTVFGTSLGSGPDFVFPQQSIGFAFPLAGTTYSNVHVGDKGYLFLSNGGAPTFMPPTAAAAVVANGNNVEQTVTLPSPLPIAGGSTMGLCQAYGNGNLLSLPVPTIQGTSTALLPIASNPALVGISITSQSLAFSPATPLGLIASNGMQMTIGLQADTRPRRAAACGLETHAYP